MQVVHKILQRLKSDEALMLAFQRGDSAAFEVLYTRYKDRLFGFIYKSSAQSLHVEDVAHDTWLAVINSAPNYQRSAQFKTWLYHIAHNKIIDAWRRDKKIDRSVYLEGEELHSSSANAESSLAGPERGNVKEPHNFQGIDLSDADIKVLALQAVEHIENLPADQQQAFLLREQGFSLQEISSVTQSSPEAVKSRLRYATKKLRLLLSG